MTTDPDIAAIVTEALGAVHPTRSAHRLLASRVAALERKVGYLSEQLEALAKLLDALTQDEDSDA